MTIHARATNRDMLLGTPQANEAAHRSTDIGVAVARKDGGSSAAHDVLITIRQ